MKHLLQNYVVESLRKVIQQKGFRHEDVATQMNLSRQSISNYLTHRTEMSLNVFERFCNALGVSASSILENYDNQIAPGSEVHESVSDYKTPLALLKLENKHLKNEVETYKKIETVLNRQIDDLYKQLSSYESTNQK